MYADPCSPNNHSGIKRGFCPRCHQLVEDGEIVFGTIRLGTVVIEFQPTPITISMSGREPSSCLRAVGCFEEFEQEVRVSNGALTVNDQKYGHVNDGDHVIVERGIVTVNGVKRRLEQ